MTERLTCKKDCYYWNEYDQDCECLGENHPCPRKCYIFKEKYPEKFQNKKCKTLTEQWRDGTLPTGSYYIRIITGNEKSDYFEGKKFCFWSDYEVEEVLALVPSYNEYKRLQEQLKEANKVLSALITPQTPSLDTVINYLEKWGIK